MAPAGPGTGRGESASRSRCDPALAGVHAAGTALPGVSLLALLGLRYPLRMVPLLLFELTWKTVWVLAIGLPLWRTGRLDAATSETWFACLMGLVIFPLAIPWGHVVRHYVTAPAERWGAADRGVRAAREPGTVG